MKSIVAFESSMEAAVFEPMIQRLMERLHVYKRFLEQEFQLSTLPNGVIWTSNELATTTFSTNPVPAYAREDFIYITPDLSVWRDLMILQLDDKALPEVRSYYESFTEDQLFEILAHELTHYIDLFVDEFDDARMDSIWFEEGMCFYLPRKYALSADYFNEITKIEGSLAKEFKFLYGDHSLDDFGAKSYQGSLSSIMYDYWRSYLMVVELVEKVGGNVHKLFSLYHNWDKGGRKEKLTEYFEMTL